MIDPRDIPHEGERNGPGDWERRELRKTYARIKALEAALERCIKAHETGRFEPAQIAYEAAKNTLADDPA